MNRPESLERLLKSLSGTAWEFDNDSIQLEIHVDKDPSGGQKKSWFRTKADDTKNYIWRKNMYFFA